MDEVNGYKLFILFIFKNRIIILLNNNRFFFIKPIVFMTTTKYDDIDKAPQIVLLCQLYLESYGLKIKTFKD